MNGYYWQGLIYMSSTTMLQTHGNGEAILGSDSEAWQSLLWSEYGCWLYMQKLLTTASSSQMTVIWDCSPNRNLLLATSTSVLYIINVQSFWAAAGTSPLEPMFHLFLTFPYHPTKSILKPYALGHHLLPVLLWVILCPCSCKLPPKNSIAHRARLRWITF